MGTERGPRTCPPVQVTAWGYVSGTGLDAMQYLLADPVTVPPEERAGYSEEIVDLPSVLCYAPPPQTPAVSPLPARARGFVTFGAFTTTAPVMSSALITAPGVEIVRPPLGVSVVPGGTPVHDASG